MPCAIGPSATMSSTDFFLPKPGFLKIYLNFQRQKSLKKSISPTFWIQILANKFHLNPAHQDLSNNTKGTFQFLRNFQFNLIFSEEIIQYSRTQVQTTWNQADAPLLLKSFPKRPRTRPEASRFSGSHKYKQNNTNKLPSFIDRWKKPCNFDSMICKIDRVMSFLIQTIWTCLVK